MKRATRTLLAACAIFAVVGPASADHSWGSYHWARQSNPFTLKVNAVLTGAWPGIVANSVGEWDQSQVIDFAKTSSGSYLFPGTTSAKQCNPTAGQIVVCNATYGQRGWLGIASIWANGNHITQGTTKLNDTYFSMARYNTIAWKAMVACQEIGHDFGLGHVNETFTDPNTGSCMDYTNDPSGTKGTNGTLANVAPNSHDYSWLSNIYAHLDSTNTANTSGASTNFGIREVGKAAPTVRTPPKEGAGDTAAEWGSAIHRDGKGRPDQFIRRFADGSVMITHVLWTPDAKGTEAGPVHEEDGHTH